MRGNCSQKPGVLWKFDRSKICSVKWNLCAFYPVIAPTESGSISGIFCVRRIGVLSAGRGGVAQVKGHGNRVCGDHQISQPQSVLHGAGLIVELKLAQVLRRSSAETIWYEPHLKYALEVGMLCR
jgi:hypothetical protein